MFGQHNHKETRLFYQINNTGEEQFNLEGSDIERLIEARRRIREVMTPAVNRGLGFGKKEEKSDV